MALDDKESPTISIKKLNSALSSDDDITRIQARQALKAMGEVAVPFLIEALEEPDNIERWEAAKTLAEIGSPSAVPGLIKALENEEFEVRWVAADGLIKIGPGALKPLLQALVNHGESVLLREGAHRIIHELAKEELSQYLTPLLTSLEGKAPEVEVPIKALQALESIDKLQLTVRKVNEALLRQLAIFQLTTLGQRIVNTSPRQRIRSYVKVLNEQRAKDLLKHASRFLTGDSRREIPAGRI